MINIPKELESCVDKLVADPNFKPKAGRTKEESAFAVCQESIKQSVDVESLLEKTPAELVKQEEDKLSEEEEEETKKKPRRKKEMDKQEQIRKLWIPFHKCSKSGRVTGILSSSSIDRDGERIGKNLLWKWSQMEDLPMLADHTNTTENLIGSLHNLKFVENNDDSALQVEPVFFSEKANPKAAQIKAMLSEGGKLGMSIGAIPKKSKDVIVEKTSGEKETVKEWTEAELLEGSITPIPSNRDTFMSLSKKFNIKEDRTMSEDQIKKNEETPESTPEPEPTPEPEKPAEAEKSAEPEPESGGEGTEEKKEASFSKEQKEIIQTMIKAAVEDSLRKSVVTYKAEVEQTVEPVSEDLSYIEKFSEKYEKGEGLFR